MGCVSLLWNTDTMCTNRYNLQCTLLYLICSLCSIVLGLSLVLVLMVYLVLPALNADSVNQKECIIDKLVIQNPPSKYDVNVHVKDLAPFDAMKKDDTNTILHQEVTRYPEDMNCLKVLVHYNVPNFGKRTGYLYSKEFLFNGTSKGNCFCEKCLIAKSHPPFTRHSASDSKTEVLLKDTDTLKFFLFKIGDMIKCYNKHDKNDSQGYKQHVTSQDWHLLVVMIWPTLLFICGFVGLFFSSLGLYQIMMEIDENKRREQQGIML